MRACSTLLRRQFPHLNGLEDTILQINNSFNVPTGKYIQILHVNGNHWNAISSIGEKDITHVRIFDSLRHIPPADTLETIAKFECVAQSADSAAQSPDRANRSSAHNIDTIREGQEYFVECGMATTCTLRNIGCGKKHAESGIICGIKNAENSCYSLLTFANVSTAV